MQCCKSEFVWRWRNLYLEKKHSLHRKDLGSGRFKARPWILNRLQYSFRYIIERLNSRTNGSFEPNITRHPLASSHVCLQGFLSFFLVAGNETQAARTRVVVCMYVCNVEHATLVQTCLSYTRVKNLFGIDHWKVSGRRRRTSYWKNLFVARGIRF